MLFGGKSRIRVHVRQLRINLGILWRLLRVSFTGILQFLIATASWTGLVRLCATFGSVPVAGYTVAIRIFMFVILPSWGLSNSAATLVGQNLESKEARTRRKGRLPDGGRYTMAYMGSIAIVFLVFARQLAAFFTSDPAVQSVAAGCLRFISVGNICYAWGMVLR